jgi:hypothetical protein
MDGYPFSGHVKRLRLIVSSYLDEGEPLESAAKRLAAALAEFQKELADLPPPTKSFPASSVPTFYVNELLGDLRPDMSREDFLRIRELLNAAGARMGGRVDGAV